MTPIRDQYRLAWRSYLLSNSFAVMHLLEEFMDELQEDIGDGPGCPVWLDFVETMPGFVSYWSNPNFQRF